MQSTGFDSAIKAKLDNVKTFLYPQMSFCEAKLIKNCSMLNSFLKTLLELASKDNVLRRNQFVPNAIISCSAKNISFYFADPLIECFENKSERDITLYLYSL